MGLDVSVVRTPKNLDLEELYAVNDAIGNCFSWYLGDDKEKRGEKWKELKAKAESLAKADVLNNLKGPDDLVRCITEMSDKDFDMYLKMVVASITEHEDGNTHLNFDYEKLPGEDIMDSCSWNLRNLFVDCKKDKRTFPPCGDFVCELDGYKVWSMNERWKEKSFKLWLAKWISYFSERVGFNILADVLRDLGVNDVFVDFSDVNHYKRNIAKVADGILDNKDRYWLVSSY